MSKYTLSLLRAGDPKMDSARLFASSVYLDRHDAANTTVPDWTILLEDQNGPCASFSVFDPETHSPLFFTQLFEKEWETIKLEGGRVAEAGALAIQKRDDRVFTVHAPIVLSGALALSMQIMGYSAFVCVANRFVYRFTRAVGASCDTIGPASPALLPPEMSRAMASYFAAEPSGHVVYQRIDRKVLVESLEKSLIALDVDVSAFEPLAAKVAA